MIGTITIQERQVGYSQNLEGLQAAWAERIASRARASARAAAADAVERMLLDSPQWENVAATHISDIAYEAASAALR